MQAGLHRVTVTKGAHMKLDVCAGGRQRTFGALLHFARSPCPVLLWSTRQAWLNDHSNWDSEACVHARQPVILAGCGVDIRGWANR